MILRPCTRQYSPEGLATDKIIVLHGDWHVISKHPLAKKWSIMGLSLSLVSHLREYCLLWVYRLEFFSWMITEMSLYSDATSSPGRGIRPKGANLPRSLATRTGVSRCLSDRMALYITSNYWYGSFCYYHEGSLEKIPKQVIQIQVKKTDWLIHFWLTST